MIQHANQLELECRNVVVIAARTLPGGLGARRAVSNVYRHPLSIRPEVARSAVGPGGMRSGRLARAQREACA
jgi:hypothetical protein